MLHWHCGRTPWRRKNFIPCLQRESDGKCLVSAYVKVPVCIFYCSDAAKTEILSVWLQPRQVFQFVFLKLDFTEEKDKMIFCTSVLWPSNFSSRSFKLEFEWFNEWCSFSNKSLIDHWGDNGPQRKTWTLPVFAGLWSADLIRIEHFYCDLIAESKTHKHGRVNVFVKEQIKCCAMALVSYQNVYSHYTIWKARIHFIQITHTNSAQLSLTAQVAFIFFLFSFFFLCTNIGQLKLLILTFSGLICMK